MASFCLLSLQSHPQKDSRGWRCGLQVPGWGFADSRVPSGPTLQSRVVWEVHPLPRPSAGPAQDTAAEETQEQRAAGGQMLPFP